MELAEELEKNKRQFENGEINEDKFHECRKLILEKWSSGSGGLIKSKEVELSRGIANRKPKETDLYAILQLEPNATEAEIRSSYRKLALKHHPDKNGGIATEEWKKLSRAYEILSDANNRYLYDNYGAINNSLSNKTSLNVYVGGELWKPYIGNLELGIWLFSFKNRDSSEQEMLTSAEQKERRHAIRISSIVRHLQNKLSQFPKQLDNPPELESFVESLNQEARNLSEEPNGKELLSFIGEIYVSESQSISVKPSDIFQKAKFVIDLISGYLTIKTSSSKPSLEEASKIIWKLSRSELSSVVHETCSIVLTDESRNEDERCHLVNSLQLLGKVWLEVSRM
ncbi:DnaJ-domain-containing protein [Gigaspora margarita]|uniref:DnaJ-domain-containing protein n=1 Tax=Gigaspora margarita TaxID=4874 RepID=A0A8H4B5D9_GIGMA|nr:DnaJ-domain-containing protein [Gigaspora margarita]